MTATIGRTPVRRWATLHDFETVGAFLADPSLIFHTGDSMVVDGGYTIFVAFGRGGQLKPYRHAYVGSVAGLGHHQGVAQVYRIRLTSLEHPADDFRDALRAA